MISVVIPVYNSEKTVSKLCLKLINEMESNSVNFEIILVDDKSTDNSYCEIKKLAKRYKNIKCIKLKKNFGQQNALFCGLNFAKGDYIITMDDDLQNSPSDIFRLYNTILKGYDVVYAIPFDKKHSTYRNVFSRINDFVFTKLFNKPKDIKISSFRIMNKKIVEKIKLETGAFIYLSAAIFKHTKDASNIKVEHIERNTGKSNYSVLKLGVLFTKLIIYYSDIKMFKFFKSYKPQYEIEEVIN